MPEHAHFKKGTKIKLFLTLLLAAALFLFFWKSDAKSVLIEFQDDSLTLRAPEEDAFSLTVPYAGILSLTSLSQLELGTCLDGVDTESRKNGAWYNQTLGEYTLCIYTDVPAYILLHTTDGIIVFNYEDEATTYQLCEALAAHLEEKGAGTNPG